MNQVATNVNSWLSSIDIDTTANNYLKSQPDHSFNVNNVIVRLDDSIKLFNYLKELILQSIASETFDSLPAPSQHNIHAQVQSIFQNRTNVNLFIQANQTLYYHVVVSGLELKLKDYNNFKQALTDIANLRRSYGHTLKGLEGIKEKVIMIENSYNKSNELSGKFQKVNDEINQKIAQTNKYLTESATIRESMSKNLQDSENSKKEIVAFKTNIDSYKKEIGTKTTEVKEIIAKINSQKDTVEKLINDAERALMLKSSQGISAALSSQYDIEKDTKKMRPWLHFSLVFMGFALIGILLFILDIKIASWSLSADGVNAIVARIIFVGISITGASFCATQYIKQKSLADDYGFKLVLAKSLIAFAQELKKYDPQKAIDYMKGVLEEINRSPISKSKDDGITKKDIGLFQNLFDTVQKFVKN